MRKKKSSGASAPPPNLRKARDATDQFGERHPELLQDLQIFGANAENSLDSLKKLLAVAAQDDDKVAYSFFLQSWLRRQGVSPPLGVFEFDPLGRGRGRPPTAKRLKSYAEFLENPTQSYGQIAQKVLSAEYKESPDKAAKHARSLVESVFQKIGPHGATLPEMREVISYAYRQMKAAQPHKPRRESSKPRSRDQSTD